jgi:hypothetical protein
MAHSRTRALLFGLLAFIVCGFLYPEGPHAALLTYDFEGTVDNAPSTYPFSSGQIITGSFTYDSSTADGTPADPVNGNYYSVMTSLSFSLGSYVGGTDGSGVSQIRLVNNSPGTGFSDYWISLTTVTAPNVNGASLQTIELLLQDPQALALTNKALGPITPFPAWRTSIFQLAFRDSFNSSSVVEGHLTSLAPVPLPAAAILFPSGLGLLAFAFRRVRGTPRQKV